MIALCRADDTRTYTIDDGSGNTTDIIAPDLKLPQRAEWRAFATAFGFQVHVDLDNKSATTSWAGPYTIGAASTYYIVDPGPWYNALVSQLGAPNVARWLTALQTSQAVRNFAVAEGLAPLLNSSAQPVYYYPPNTICGTKPADLMLGDGETVDDLQVLV